jgi:hypothetical protein
VRLRGLPYTTKEDEIIDFFKGIKVESSAPVGCFEEGCFGEVDSPKLPA